MTETTDPIDPEQVKWAGKIAALLAKAESATPEEAETFTEKAMELMAKFNITQSLLDMRRAAAGQKSESIVKYNFRFTGTYHRALLYTFDGIAKALGLQASFHRYSNESVLNVYGFETDVEQAKLLMTSLQLQLTTALTAWWKTYDDKSWMRPMEKFKSRRTFMFAFGEGVENRLYTARRNAVAEAESTTPGTSLVLRDRKTQLEQYYGTLGVKSVKVQQTISDYDAYTEGYESGSNADTGQKRVVNKRTAIES